MSERMAEFKEAFDKHVQVEKNLLGEKVWKVDADKVSPEVMREIRDAATAQGARVELEQGNRDKIPEVPPAPGVKEQAYRAAGLDVSTTRSTASIER